jgi:hypothetical protein
MKNQHPTSQRIKPILRVILVGLALIILAEGLDLPARHVTDFLTTVVQHTLVLLPSLALTAWQGLHPVPFEHSHFSACPLQMLVSSWSLLLTVVAGI